MSGAPSETELLTQGTAANDLERIFVEEGEQVVTEVNGKRSVTLPFVEDRSRSSAWKKKEVKRRVLVAVDPSQHSKVAFDWYLNNIWKPDDLVIVLYCPEPPNLPSFRIRDGLALPTERWREIIVETNNRASRLEIDYESKCIEKKLNYIIRVDMGKRPGDGIIAVVEKEKADLIVMGSRGMGAMKRFFLGSVSEFVTRNARVPCVVVPNEGGGPPSSPPPTKQQQ